MAKKVGMIAGMNRRDLLKERLKPINRLMKWAWVSGELGAYRHYNELFSKEYVAYSHAEGVYK